MLHLDFIRAADREMQLPSEPDQVGSAKLWNCRYNSLEPLGRLHELRTLEIMSFPDATLEVVGKLTRLRYLRIIHLPHVKSLEPLANLAELETLGLETLPSWDSSGKVTEVRSLDPLGRLKHLRHIQLFGVRPPDESLRALEGCTALESGRFSEYPGSETERFYAATGISKARIPEPQFATG